MISQFMDAWSKLWEGISISREQKHRCLLESWKHSRIQDFSWDHAPFQIRILQDSFTKGEIAKTAFSALFQSLRVVVSFATVNSWKFFARLPLLPFSFFFRHCRLLTISLANSHRIQYDREEAHSCQPADSVRRLFIREVCKGKVNSEYTENRRKKRW